MTASQNNAHELNPNKLDLTKVATYDRVVNAPINRAWENVLDWAHLPYLHESTFDYVELDAAGDWGWRTWSNAQHTDHVELTLAEGGSYVARSYQAGHQVSEIWTTLVANGEQTKVQVEFFLPNVESANVAAFGDAMRSLYTTLWDEDEAMMCERHARLLEQRDNASETNLGREATLLQQLQKGQRVVFQLQKREYQLREHNGALVAHSSICPHLLGPLTDADLSTGTLRCPWHGYEFDLNTGTCTFPIEADCKLAPAPQLVASEGNIIARL